MSWSRGDAAVRWSRVMSRNLVPVVGETIDRTDDLTVMIMVTVRAHAGDPHLFGGRTDGESSGGSSDAISLPSGILSQSLREQEKAFTHINNCLWSRSCLPEQSASCAREKFITFDSLAVLKCWSFALMRKGKGS